MKKIIIAMENDYLFRKIKEQRTIYKKIQYREAILEILEKDKYINDIIIDENIPGEINIEKLIKQIILINPKINIIFFLEKEDNKKTQKLNKLGIKKILINNKKNLDKIINNLFKEKNDNKIITIEGNPKTGKTTITSLIIKILINKNKKVLLINLNKKTEEIYLKILKTTKKEMKNKNKKTLDENKIIKNFKNNEIRINENVVFINNFQILINKDTKKRVNKFIEKYSKIYDYIIFDIGNINIKNIKNQIIKISSKNILVINSKEMEINKLKEIKNLKRDQFYIIDNKYNLLSINKLIIKNILGKKLLYYSIKYNKKYKNIIKNFYKNEKIKINNKIQKKILNILEKNKRDEINYLINNIKNDLKKIINKYKINIR